MRNTRDFCVSSAGIIATNSVNLGPEAEHPVKIKTTTKEIHTPIILYP